MSKPHEVPPYLNAGRETDPRNPWLRTTLIGAVSVAIGGITVGGGLALHNQINQEQPFDPDQCASGKPTPGKGGNSAVYHALENMEPSVTVSNQTIASLGRQANALFDGTMDVSDTVEVCVDLDRAIVKITQPSPAE